MKETKKSLGISRVIITQFAWSKRSDDTEGTQIDLLILRNQNILITTFGLSYSEYAGVFSNVITLNELFDE